MCGDMERKTVFAVNAELEMSNTGGATAVTGVTSGRELEEGITESAVTGTATPGATSGLETIESAKENKA